MEIRDVIHSIREKSLEHSLAIESLQSHVVMLERFVWQLVSALGRGDEVTVTFLEDVSRETEKVNGDSTLF